MLNHRLITVATVLACGIAGTIGTNADAARVQNGFGLVSPTSNDQRTCITESWGAAVNTCSNTVIGAMYFNLAIDGGGTKGARLTPAGSGSSFSCFLQAISRDGSTHTDGGSVTVNSSPVTLPSIYVNAYYTLRVVCNNVYSGRGVSSVDWDI